MFKQKSKNDVMKLVQSAFFCILNPHAPDRFPRTGPIGFSFYPAPPAHALLSRKLLSI